ncbi:hypothetical protein B4098_3185 [Heyndrickxia coagulans]|uniref:Uncharacterized protein n=1 Tax=Heyndrickxia coagulans TaxID=1398 RepID=A0A150K4F4_HEYCO|nr:hypothetical protein B4098_3185 [Heyndrickxia coagulans]
MRQLSRFVSFFYVPPGRNGMKAGFSVGTLLAYLQSER